MKVYSAWVAYYGGDGYSRVRVCTDLSTALAFAQDVSGNDKHWAVAYSAMPPTYSKGLPVGTVVYG